jgi:hypothetical protein
MTTLLEPAPGCGRRRGGAIRDGRRRARRRRSRRATSVLQRFGCLRRCRAGGRRPPAPADADAGAPEADGCDPRTSRRAAERWRCRLRHQLAPAADVTMEFPPRQDRELRTLEGSCRDRPARDTRCITTPRVMDYAALPRLAARRAVSHAFSRPRLRTSTPTTMPAAGYEAGRCRGGHRELSEAQQHRIMNCVSARAAGRRAVAGRSRCSDGGEATPSPPEQRSAPPRWPACGPANSARHFGRQRDHEPAAARARTAPTRSSGSPSAGTPPSLPNG